MIGPPEKPSLGESPGSRSGWYFTFPPETTNLAFAGNTHTTSNKTEYRNKTNTQPGQTALFIILFQSHLQSPGIGRAY